MKKINDSIFLIGMFIIAAILSGSSLNEDALAAIILVLALIVIDRF